MDDTTTTMTTAKRKPRLRDPSLDPAPEPVATRDESKRDRFLRIAEPRVRRAIKAIEIVGLIGGSNKSNYDYGMADVEEIAGALREAIDIVEMRLGRKPRQLKLFELHRGNGGA